MRDVTEPLTDNPHADIIGILDDLDAAAAQPVPGPICSVTAALERIAAEDPDIAGKVRQRVDDARFPATGVADVLTKRTGVQVASQSLRRHRRRGTPSGCRCAQ